MESVAKALLTAKEEVFITDWWLSPEIAMIRPCEDESFRLDNLLGRIAVRIIVKNISIQRERNQSSLITFTGQWCSSLCVSL
jgi:phospholipase D1/2